MNSNIEHSGSALLIRGAALWLLAALVLAWCLVGLNFDVSFVKALFPGKFTRLLQAHIDFLLMSALIIGFYSTRIALPQSVRWAMVIGAFTNSSLFLLLAMFPVLDSPSAPDSTLASVFRVYLFASLLTTSYGFGRGAMTVLKSTLAR
jgi:hypothetical protein